MTADPRGPEAYRVTGEEEIRMGDLETGDNGQKRLQQQLDDIQRALDQVTVPHRAEELLQARGAVRQKLEAIAVCLRNREMAQEVRDASQTRSGRISALRARQAILVEEIGRLEVQLRRLIEEARGERPDLGHLVSELPGVREHVAGKRHLQVELKTIEHQLLELGGDEI